MKMDYVVAAAFFRAYSFLKTCTEITPNAESERLVVSCGAPGRDRRSILQNVFKKKKAWPSQKSTMRENRDTAPA